MLKRFPIFVSTLANIALWHGTSAWACSVCFGGASDAAMDGYNASVLFLMVTPYLVVGTIVGAVVLYATGYVIFNLLFADFYAANVGSATGVDKTPQVQWALAAGSLTYAALISLMIDRAPSPSLANATMIGAPI